MSQLFGWAGASGEGDPSRVGATMGRALSVMPDQPQHVWTVDDVAVGILECAIETGVRERYAPAVSKDGRHWLWMAGEAFEDLSQRLHLKHVDESRTAAFRVSLLEELIRHGPEAIRDLDGEYQIAWWDRAGRTLTLLNDRFGGLPLYYARSRAGFAFAGGVRGVLAAPGISRDPDLSAIREAVTFGGFRLGDRTNVAAVKMLAGASCLTLRDDAISLSRYWRWSDIPSIPARDVDEAVDEVHHRWRASIERRLAGAARPGQTLSGGLDSRAILAECAGRSPGWTAITYGVDRCDEVDIARRAATRAGAEWLFHPLYDAGGAWLERRTSFIQQTDGLIDLADLMHLDALPLQASRIDVHLSGYIGDVVSGPTYNSIRTAADVALQLPFYGAGIGYDYTAAVAIAESLAGGVQPAAPRFAIFEHKFPQSTNRWTAAWRPWVRVRKPFVAYRFFDFCQGLPSEMRGAGALHERWLSSRYPALFASIPNAKTGVPALSAAWRVHAARGTRMLARRIGGGLKRMRVPISPRAQTYHPDETYWRTPGVHARIEGAILRPESIVAEVFGRQTVANLLHDWFTSAAVPTQIIGALYSYECYHRDLAAHLSTAAAPPKKGSGVLLVEMSQKDSRPLFHGRGRW